MIFHLIAILLTLVLGRAMDIQKPWETVHTGRLGSATKDWFVLAPASCCFGLINCFVIQPGEIQTHRRSARSVLVGVERLSEIKVV